MLKKLKLLFRFNNQLLKIQNLDWKKKSDDSPQLRLFFPGNQTFRSFFSIPVTVLEEYST